MPDARQDDRFRPVAGQPGSFDVVQTLTRGYCLVGVAVDGSDGDIRRQMSDG